MSKDKLKDLCSTLKIDPEEEELHTLPQLVEAIFEGYKEKDAHLENVPVGLLASACFSLYN